MPFIVEVPESPPTPYRESTTKAVPINLMAASEIDQKILGRIATSATAYDSTLSTALFQLLGLSIRLSRKLYQARGLSLDTPLSIQAADLCHSVVWLSKEGLSILEGTVLPRCQDDRVGARCLVMVAKLRASFHHVYSLFHNNPPISQLSPANQQTSPAWLHPDRNAPRPGAATTPTARPRQNIPSMTSESSYITNPFPSDPVAPTSPPAYAIPPAPFAPSTRRLKPKLLDIHSAKQRSNADYLLESINFVPRTSNYFQVASSLAARYLSGSDPLRLSIALEQCVFIDACTRNTASASERARAALHDVYSAPEGMDDADFQDAATLVQALTLLGNREQTPRQSDQPSLSMQNNATDRDPGRDSESDSSITTVLERESTTDPDEVSRMVYPVHKPHQVKPDHRPLTGFVAVVHGPSPSPELKSETVVGKALAVHLPERVEKPVEVRKGYVGNVWKGKGRAYL